VCACVASHRRHLHGTGVVSNRVYGYACVSVVYNIYVTCTCIFFIFTYLDVCVYSIVHTGMYPYTYTHHVRTSTFLCVYKYSYRFSGRSQVAPVFTGVLRLAVLYHVKIFFLKINVGNFFQPVQLLVILSYC